MTDLKQKGVNAFLWDFGGQFAKQGISFIISIFLARLLIPSDFGLLAMVNVFLALSYSFMDMGLGNSLIQRKNLTEEHYSSVLYFNIAMGFLLALILFFLAVPIASFYKQPILKDISRVLSLNFIINSLTIVQNSKYTKALNFKALTKARLIAGFSSGTIAVFLAHNGFGVWSLVVQTILSNLIYSAIVWLWSRWIPLAVFKFEKIKELWGYGFRMFIAGSMDNIISNADAVIIGKLFSAATLGQFYRAKSFNSFAMQYTSGSLMKVYFPLLSSLQDDREKYINVVFKTFHVLNFVTFLLLGSLFIGANDIIILLFGSKWQPAIEYFKILLLCGFAYPIGSLLGNIPSSLGNSKAFLKIYIIANTYVVLNLVVGFLFGLKGYLYGLAIVNLLNIIVNIYFASKELSLKFNSFSSIVLNYLLSTIPLILIIMHVSLIQHIGNRLFRLLILVSVFTLTYIFVQYLLKSKGLSYLRSELTGVLTKIRAKNK